MPALWGSKKILWKGFKTPQDTQIPPLAPFRANLKKTIPNSSIISSNPQLLLLFFFSASSSLLLLPFYMDVAGRPRQNPAPAIRGLEVSFRSMTRVMVESSPALDFGEHTALHRYLRKIGMLSGNSYAAFANVKSSYTLM